MINTLRFSLAGMKELKTYRELEIENHHLRRQLKDAGIAPEPVPVDHHHMQIVYQANRVNSDKSSSLYSNAQAIVEKMNQGVVLLDHNGEILYANEKFADILGLPFNKIIGLPFSSFIESIHTSALIETLMKGKSQPCSVVMDVRASGGELNPMRLSVFAVNDHELAVMMTDLTQHRSTEEDLLLSNQRLVHNNLELETRNSDLQEFASVASHDLQEPLRKMQMFATLLKDKHHAEFTADGSILLDKIIASSARMKSMIFEILNYSRVSSNMNTFVLANLNDIVDEVLDDYEMVIAEKKAQISVGKLPVIEVNIAQMRQVFQNLISNALKFSKDSETPCISISGSADEARELSTIIISDNGIGFNGKHGEKIFSLLQRLNSGGKYEGAGIGLATTRKIIDKHQGTIEAIGREGEGAEFVITLPTRHYKSVW